MLTVDILKEYGANVEEGLARCLNKEDFYIKLVGIALQDENFNKLRTALEANDLDSAFEAAHALKGVLGNLALTPMLNPVTQMTELLRARTETDYRPLLKDLLSERERLLALA